MDNGVIVQGVAMVASRIMQFVFVGVGARARECESASSWADN
jgi:hypothetical protein